jgi:dihydropteroate synthase
MKIVNLNSFSFYYFDLINFFARWDATIKRTKNLIDIFPGFVLHCAIIRKE